MIIDDTPLNCPACESIDAQPRFTIQRMQVEVTAFNRCFNGKRTQPISLPVLRWGCPHCHQPFLRVVCSKCLQEWYWPLEATSRGWPLLCRDCDAGRLSLLAN